jgi:hypothetical protein
MVAAVASDEPQMAPKPAQAPTAAMATPPRQWPMKAADEAEQRARQPAVGGELAHQQEQRDDDQVVVRQPRIGQVLQRVEQRRPFAAGQPHVAAGAHREHRDADGHAQHQQHQHDAEQHQAGADAAHRNTPRTCSATR